MSEFESPLGHLANPRVAGPMPYPAELAAILEREQCELARSEISTWPGYAVTPLYDLTELADDIGVARIWYKDESQRFHLKSFKALGGAYAVLRHLQQCVRAAKGVDASLEDLRSGRHADCIDDIVISCATDGNHGGAMH